MLPCLRRDLFRRLELIRLPLARQQLERIAVDLLHNALHGRVLRQVAHDPELNMLEVGAQDNPPRGRSDDALAQRNVHQDVVELEDLALLEALEVRLVGRNATGASARLQKVRSYLAREASE